MQNYGGGEVNIIDQVPLTVSCGDHHCQAMVIVQKGVNLEFLLGTDLLACLGFHLTCEGNATDLLGKRADVLMNAASSKGQTDSLMPPAEVATVTNMQVVVRLLESVKLPGHHS